MKFLNTIVPVYIMYGIVIYFHLYLNTDFTIWAKHTLLVHRKVKEMLWWGNTSWEFNTTKQAGGTGSSTHVLKDSKTYKMINTFLP